MKLLRHYFLIICFTCISINSLAQVPALWRIGRYGGLNFDSPATPFLYQDTVLTLVAISSMWDQNGKLLFFSNGLKVTDSLFNELPNSPLFTTLPQASQPWGSHVNNSSIILPRPGYADQYYIFHENSIYSPGNENVSLYYSLIDKTMNGGLGDITNIKNVVLGDSLWYGALSAVKHGNGRDWWLVSGKYKSQFIYTWLVQPDTIIGPFQQNIGLTWNVAAIGTIQSCISEDGERFAITYQEMVNNQRRLLFSQFDRCTGNFYDTLHINIVNSDSMYTYSGLYGCSFSPSGRFLYASSATYMYQFDLQSPNIPASIIEVGVHDHAFVPFNSGFGFQKLAPDGRIYIQPGGANYVAGAIHYPDSLGLACQVELRYLDYFTQFGSSDISIGVFPNYPNYNLGPMIGSSCDTLTSINQIETYKLDIVSIYPNPAINNFTVMYKLPPNKVGKLELSDILGNLIYSESLSQWSSVHQVQLDLGISNGLYLCKISSGDWVDFCKILISN